MTPHRKQLLARALAAALFCGVGAMHFVRADLFLAIMPPYIPAQRPAVLVSGVFEILGGLGMLAPSQPLRRVAAYGLVALLLSVFIVNIDMALHGSPMRNGAVVPGGSVALWLRLPMQFVFMWLVMYASRALPSAPEPPRVERAIDEQPEIAQSEPAASVVDDTPTVTDEIDEYPIAAETDPLR